MLEFWRKKGSIAYRRVKQVKKGERKEERSDTAHPLQKASIDKMKEGKRNFETTFTQLTCDTEVTSTVVIELPKTTFKHYFVEQTRTDDIIENSNIIDLLKWMIKLKSNNTN